MAVAVLAPPSPFGFVRPDAAGAAPLPAATYTITDLGALGAETAFAINDAGDVVGTMNASHAYHGFKYTFDRLNNTGNLQDLGPGGVFGVSESGVVVGSGRGAPAGGGALAISPDGKTVGGLAFAQGPIPPSVGSGTSVPATWTAAAGWQPLYGAGCNWPLMLGGAAAAVNDSKTVVGQGLIDDDYTATNGIIGGIAFKCEQDPANPGQYIGRNLAPWSGPYAGAFAVTFDGVVVGKAHAPNNPIQAYLWQGGTAEALGTNAEGHAPPAGAISQSAAYGVNEFLDVVGSYGEVATSPWLQAGSRKNRAWVMYGDDGNMLDLTDMLGPGTPWTLHTAFDVNDKGQIVGEGTVGGEMRAFLLTPIADVNLTAQNIMVTQVVQNERNLDLLIAGKQTYAIVRVKSDTRDVRNVSAVLRGRRGATALGEIAPAGRPVTVRRDPRKELVEHSFLFALPREWSEGYGSTLSLEAVVNPDFEVPETRYTDNTARTTVSFNGQPGVFKVVVVDAFYAGQPVPRPDTAAFAQAARRLERYLPVARPEIRYDAVPLEIPEPAWAAGDSSTGKCARIVATLAEKRRELRLGRQTLLYAQMARGSDGRSPYAATTGSGEDLGAGILGCSYVPDMVATGVTYDTSMSSEDVAAHEVFHAIGRNHVPECGATGADSPPYPSAGGKVGGGSLRQAIYPLPEGTDLGFDGTQLVHGWVTADIMSYCNALWISDYTYENLYRLIPDIGRRNRSSLATSEVHVVASADLAGGQTDLSATASPVEGPMPEPVAGPYRIRFSAGGALLSEVAASAARMGAHADEVDETPLALVNETVELPPGADRLAVFDVRSGTELAAMAITGGAPGVSVIAPAAGAALPASGPFTVEWSSSDPDGDPLTHDVLYRAAADEPWTILGAGIAGESFTVDAGVLAGSDTGTLRVVARDGFFTGRDEVTDLRVPAKAPVVIVEAPAGGALLTTEQSVLLEGRALPVGHEVLADGAYEWSSDRDGPLGTGPSLLVPALSVGTHEIELRVTAAGGATAHATTTVEVVEPGDAPAELAASADQLRFIGDASSPPAAQPLDVFDRAGGEIEWIATTDDPRVRLSATAGTTPAAVDVSIEPSSLPAGGDLEAELTVRRADGTGNPIVVPVHVEAARASATVAPAHLDFGRQAQGTTGTPRTATFTYRGAGTMTLGAATLGGGTPEWFAIGDDACTGVALTTGQQCTVSVEFSPPEPGRRHAYLVLSDSDSGARWFVSLTGLGSRQLTQADGRLLAWGRNGSGQAGLPFDTPPCRGCVPLPTEVAGLTDVVDASAGEIASVAASADGRAWTWGSNCLGSLGRGTYDCTDFDHPVPQPVPGLTGVVDVAAGHGHALALRADGTVVGWGRNAYGEVNGWAGGNTANPIAVPGLTGVVAVAAGGTGEPVLTGGSAALGADGTVWVWGVGTTNQPQRVVLPDRATPLDDVVAIEPFMALRADGTVWAWHYGAYGQRGDGTFTNPSGSTDLNFRVAGPVLAPDGSGPLTGVVQIASYDRERYALLADGSVLAWGSGVLGDGFDTTFPEDGDTTPGLALPTPVLDPTGTAPLTGVVELAAGVAARQDGSVVAWGAALSGELGNGTWWMNPYGTVVDGVVQRPPLVPRVVQAPGGGAPLTGVASLRGGRTRLALTAGAGDTALSAGPPVALTANEGEVLDAVVGTFDEDGPARAASAYAATVDWGDGSAADTAVVSGPAGGPFEVRGAHAYSDPGSYVLTVDVAGPGGDSITLTGAATVADAPLTASPAAAVTFVAGAPQRAPLGGFADADPASEDSGFTASVDWGDGTPVEPATVVGPPGGPFAVVGEHAYRRAGTYPLALRVGSGDGATLDLAGTATVLPAALHALETFTTNLAAGAAFDGPLATFGDENPLSRAGDYAAVVDWGDGIESAGTVSGPDGGPYTVTGAHTYADARPANVFVTLLGPAGASATAATTLLVDPPRIALTAAADPSGGAVPLDTTLTYTARNDGPEPLALVEVRSEGCPSATLAAGDDGNGTLDPDEAWTYECPRRFDEAGDHADVAVASAYAPGSGLWARSPSTTTAVRVTEGFTYEFGGFRQPVDNRPTVNRVRAGAAVPVKFSLGGDHGLDVFEAGSPRSQQVACGSTADVDGIEQTVNAGGSTLHFDPDTGLYVYVWKTSSSWRNTCRQLVLTFRDGTVARADFVFR